MKPFMIHHFKDSVLSGQQERLVSLIHEAAAPDMVFLLGFSLHRRRSESIFCPQSPTAQREADYCFLVLIGDSKNKPLVQWQDQLEQYCSAVMAVTTLVLETVTFQNWLAQGHLFARKVYEASCLLYNKDHVTFPAPSPFDAAAEQQVLARQYREGLGRAQGLLAGATLFRVRKQYPLSAFMLHQAAEQALTTMLKTRTGYYSCTHHIDRLLRYASLVCYQLPDVFARRTEAEKKLFTLLQKAYIDSRYGQDYRICERDLLLLTAKVERIIELLEEMAKQDPFTQ